MLEICIILGCIALGMALGWRRRADLAFLRLADRAGMLAVYGLLFVLGAATGADARIMAALPSLGARALCMALCCSAGSVLCLVPLARHFKTQSAGNRGGGALAPLAGSMKVLCAFVCGLLGARAGLVPAWLSDGSMAAWALYFLVFCVGTGLGANSAAFRIPRALRGLVLLVPALIVAGSALGALAASWLLPDMTARDALSVGMGLGYYSLSSILIEGAGNPGLASVALLANILREITAILLAPLLARFPGGLSCVGAAGATAMDTTLPVIARFGGERVAVVAVFSGMTLTLLVPFLVSAALYW